MSRDLPSWAQSTKKKKRPRLTLLNDLLDALSATLQRRRPGGVPPNPVPARQLWPRAERPGRHLTLRLLALRFDIELVGDDSLTGLRRPFVLAANEQGVLDLQLLRMAMPSQLRPTNIALSRALARGRNVIVFTDEPAAGRQVGEFSDVAAGLASQHNVAVVPVGLVGTFKLKELLKLPLRARPKVSIRFGAPLYPRGRGLQDATAELQRNVEQLVHEGELSWWTVERRRTGSPSPHGAEPAPRWRRLWDQAAPPADTRARIWR
ncbi:hypothetical protein SAMN02745244_00701 [Tessaracoccus bendigoensis DSM 12906]|uniref:1-acyl-sn-glycerol-3-phosphate acyltransferase n=1 Tax=Tessaracoccus bendigoensis DSM 12906 TaxID=1123357 RepID=A0A1M6CLS9_9ACTN|nr:hypothetical protein [Tessaracoccus bendigoensis]SHI61801.1 hypothetical protein SAMN02745244_00701 [Tessaracoccus bendigoensis DSM 12906]